MQALGRPYTFRKEAQKAANFIILLLKPQTKILRPQMGHASAATSAQTQAKGSVCFPTEMGAPTMEQPNG